MEGQRRGWLDQEGLAPTLRTSAWYFRPSRKGPAMQSTADMAFYNTRQMTFLCWGHPLATKRGSIDPRPRKTSLNGCQAEAPKLDHLWEGALRMVLMNGALFSLLLPCSIWGPSKTIHIFWFLLGKSWGRCYVCTNNTGKY